MIDERYPSKTTCFSFSWDKKIFHKAICDNELSNFPRAPVPKCVRKKKKRSSHSKCFKVKDRKKETHLRAQNNSIPMEKDSEGAG